MATEFDYPPVLDETLVGSYPARAGAGGGYVWDAVLEYRVWCHPERGAPDLAEGSDYDYAFASYAEARDFSEASDGAEEPLALIVQEEHVNEPEPGSFVHVRERRVAEWPVDFLSRPARDEHTIPALLATHPSDRPDLLGRTNPPETRE